MKNMEQIKERYLQEPFNMRLGHLAADLARLSTFSNKEAIRDILEETKFFIEWTAREASFDIQAILSEIQSKVALWQRHIIMQKETSLEIEELRHSAKSWNKKLLELADITR